MWHKVIKSKFSLRPNLWDTKVECKGTFRSPWKAISSLYTEFHQLVLFKVGNGSRVRFWEDVWVGENSLEAMFPSLFRLSSLKSQPILEFYNQSSLPLVGNTCGNLHFLQSLLDREIDQLLELLQILETKMVCSSVEDRRDWIVNSSGGFFCKSAFIWMRKDNSLLVNLPAKNMWKLNIPVKVKVFTWLLVLGKLSVHTTIQKTRPYHSLSSDWCILCKKDNKSTDHLFLHCDFSLRL